MQQGLLKGKVTWIGEESDAEFWDGHWDSRIDALLAKASMPWFLRRFVLSLAPGARVLEAGCGSGKVVKAFQNHGFDVEGIDYAEKTVKVLAQRGLPIRKMDVRALDYADNAFDGYVSLGVIEHFWDEADARRTLEEAVRVVKPRGRIYCSVPFTNRIRRRFLSVGRDLDGATTENYYQRAYTEEQFRDLAKGLPADIARVSHYDALKGIGDEVPNLRWMKRMPWKVPMALIDRYTPLLRGYTHMIALELLVRK